MGVSGSLFEVATAGVEIWLVTLVDGGCGRGHVTWRGCEWCLPLNRPCWGCLGNMLSLRFDVSASIQRNMG